jgi:hypothetical protein
MSTTTSRSTPRNPHTGAELQDEPLVISGGYLAVDGGVFKEEPLKRAPAPDTRLGPVEPKSPDRTTTSPASAASASCSQPVLAGSEREADGGPGNDTPEKADGPLQGGATIRGETQTQNDEDWFFFCAAGGQTKIRFLSPGTGSDSDCYSLNAVVLDADGEEVLDPLNPSPGTAALDAKALIAGELYQVKIVADGDKCRWLLGVGPPGAVLGDANSPDDVPCLAEAETSRAIHLNSLEPNESIDEAIPVRRPPFRRAGSGSQAALTASGRIANANDEDWFVFCSTADGRAVTLRLTNVDFSSE